MFIEIGSFLSDAEGIACINIALQQHAIPSASAILIIVCL